MTVRLALPTGDLRAATVDLLARAGVGANGYEAGSRLLRAEQEGGHVIRVFRERDITIQVALGNYDLGICSDVWVAELQARFSLQRIVRLGGLPGPRTRVWVCAAPEAGLAAGELPAGETMAGARIASELPNLADRFAVHHRIPGYRLMPVYGSAEAYPPEDAEVALVVAEDAGAVEKKGLVPLSAVYEGGVALIANADSVAGRPLEGVLAPLAPFLGAEPPAFPEVHARVGAALRRGDRTVELARIALPDGHAQAHTFASLAQAGMAFEGYGEKAYTRRPRTGIEGLEAKVVRPQDMPALVASGSFDLGVTGVDWLTDHLARFPSSPVRMAVDLGRSRYRIGPVVDQGFAAETTAAALETWRALGRPVRIASEFPALAERFARDHHLPETTIIPINGASEGFVPEDADILIEGSETGTSIRANGLKMLDPFMESTNCLIVREGAITRRVDVVERFVATMAASVGAAVSA